MYSWCYSTKIEVWCVHLKSCGWKWPPLVWISQLIIIWLVSDMNLQVEKLKHCYYQTGGITILIHLSLMAREISYFFILPSIYGIRNEWFWQNKNTNAFKLCSYAAWLACKHPWICSYCKMWLIFHFKCIVILILTQVCVVWFFCQRPKRHARYHGSKYKRKWRKIYKFQFEQKFDNTACNYTLQYCHCMMEN